MTPTIDIWGIETNNLKGIDVSLVKHAVNLVVGPSGSGKSSLAYETVVLDEPLAGLSAGERDSVFENIVSLSSGHTIVVVDHSSRFLEFAQNIIALGDGGGKNGGRVIDADAFFERQKREHDFPVVNAKRFIHLQSENRVYDFRGIDVTVGDGVLNLVSGSSGVGKSTLLREYFPQHFEHYLYVSQKPLVGKKYSHVVTLLTCSSA